MSPSGFLFFGLFALVLVATYLGIRRQWAEPSIIAGGGVLGSIILIAMVSLAQGNSIAQAIIVGILVGGIFSGATLAIAWYFHSNELNAITKRSAESRPDTDT